MDPTTTITTSLTETTGTDHPGGADDAAMVPIREAAPRDTTETTSRAVATVAGTALGPTPHRGLGRGPDRPTGIARAERPATTALALADMALPAASRPHPAKSRHVLRNRNPNTIPTP